MTNNNVVDLKPQASAGAKFKISAVIDGFPLEVELEGRADNLKALIERLRALGAIPPTAKPGASNGSVPKCPVHSSPMKASRKPGAFYCPRRDEQGEYCPEKA